MNFVFLACFFCSGLTALVYELLWTRLVTNVIGGGPFAVAIILSIFMGGLGLGSFLAGKFVDRVAERRTLVRAYGILEWIIGGYALLVPLLLRLMKPLYAAVYNVTLDHFLFYNVLVLAGCALLFAVPVLCMGATLPILCKYLVTETRRAGFAIGLLYALNTLGAALGALLCGMFLIKSLGVDGTLAAAVAVNAGIGMIAFILYRKMAASPSGAGKPAASPLPVDYPPAASRTAIALFTISGFCAMAYEVMWTKLLSLMVGPTHYSFTLILVTFILGLALGSVIFGRLGDRPGAAGKLLVYSQIGAALMALCVSQFLGGSQLFFAKLMYAFRDSFAAAQWMTGLSLFLIMLPPTILLGATFSLTGKIVTRSLSSAGRSLGFAYAMNAFGSVAGSLAAGFLLVPLVGKEKGLGIAVILQLFSAFAASFLLIPRPIARPAMAAAVRILAGGGILLALFFPRWDHQALSSSKYHRLDTIGAFLRSHGWMESLVSGPKILKKHRSGELLFYGDGIGGFTTVTRDSNVFGEVEYHMANSGKFDASSRGDMNTQTLLAHFPLAFHPKPARVLIVGLASGVTAGEVLHYPVKRVDILEINDQVVKACAFFEPWNNGVLKDPRARVIVQDARAHLPLIRTEYDVIISEPSNPWMAGCATLFTKEFFEAARGRLATGGIFTQWMHTYEMDWETFAMLGRTFVSVFPNCLLVSTSPGPSSADYLFVGFKDADGGLHLKDALANLPHLNRSSNISVADPRIFFKLILPVRPAHLFGEGKVNTDNHPLIEYMAPRMINRYGVGAEIDRQLGPYRRSELAIPGVSGGLSDSAAFQLAYIRFALSLYEPMEGMAAGEAFNPEQRAMFDSLMTDFFSRNQFDPQDLPRVLKDPALRAAIARRQSGRLSDRGRDTTHLAACRFRARLQQSAGEMKAALEDYGRCLALFPEDITSLNESGIILCQNGDLLNGMKYFKKVLAIDPFQPDANVNLGICYLNSKDKVEARRMFLQALKVAPEHPMALQGLAKVGR